MLIGVMGHVDHGKTAIVRALTGMDTDRLPEEKARGISIALGFAHLPGPRGVLDLIDMPGHERFVRTMVSGATGIGAALLVVAADDGVMPQTVEHAEIAGLLGIRQAVIAISKADLVPAARVQAVARAAAALAARTGLAASPPIPVSVKSGTGLAALHTALTGLAAAPPDSDDRGFPYLPVDRAFTMPGHGTVVTGTLRHGSLSVGQTVSFLPLGLPASVPARIRGLQSHGQRIASAAPGQRVAVNLRGVARDQLGRGTALCAEATITPSVWLSVQLQTLPDAPEITNGARLRLLFGTTETGVRLRLLEGDTLAPGATGFAQLQGGSPVAVPARERFILRAESPARTVAGGLILDADTARARRHDVPEIARLAALATSSPAEIVTGAVRQAGAAGMALAPLARLAGVAPARAASWLQGGDMVITSRLFAVARAALDRLAARAEAAIAAAPDGVKRDALPGLLPDAAPALIEHALAGLLEAGRIRQHGSRVHIPRPDHDHAAAARDDALRRQLEEALRLGGLAPPDAAAIAPDPHRQRLLESLVRAGALIRAHDSGLNRDILFHRDAVAAARQILHPLLRPPGLRVAQAGAALGITRKFSVPLLDHLDRIHFTRRLGDLRVLAAESTGC